MSFELHLKLLKDAWMKVQVERETIIDLEKKLLYHKKKVRELAQDIPKKRRKMDAALEEYNKRMV